MAIAALKTKKESEGFSGFLKTGYVNIQPVQSTFTEKSIILPGAKHVFYLKRDLHTGEWLMPCTPQEFTIEFPNLSSKFVITEQIIDSEGKPKTRFLWNDKYLSRVSLTIPHEGIILNRERELDRFFSVVLNLWSGFDLDGKVRTSDGSQIKYYVEDVEKNAAAQNNKREEFLKAGNHIKNMTDMQVRQYAGIYGISTKNRSVAAIKNELFDIVEKDPELFNHRCDPKQAAYWHVFGEVKLLIEQRIVQEHADKAFWWNEIKLGRSIKECADFLLKPVNQDYYQSMIEELKSK